MKKKMDSCFFKKKHFPYFYNEYIVDLNSLFVEYCYEFRQDQIFTNDITSQKNICLHTSKVVKSNIPKKYITTFPKIKNRKQRKKM